MHHCLKCESVDIHRSRAQSTWKTWRKEISGTLLASEPARETNVNLKALDVIEPIEKTR